MLAIVSDIHGNLEAFTVVLEEIQRRGITEIVCLGDVVGYGPNPMECLDLVIKNCPKRALMGNHDFAVFYEPFNFNSGAEMACFWTRQQFENDPDPVRRANRWKFLGDLPARIKNDRFLAVHASPRRPINEYIFPDDIYTNPTKFVSIFERFEKLCFVGHTHVPGVFLEGPDFYSPDELDYKMEITDEKAIINVGSVGQPRDRDPRSSFVILNDNTLEFVRLPYDVDTTVRKVEAISQLDDFLGTRLLDGR
ncbi:MAG TPA: metallophosphoesterase family protein [Tepidisphaeraceae bacterium]|nr:metallophosphoesterase family protein [Tepidisphaeraceae bacterium]